MAGKGVAVITGGASGIGEATARRFARDGFDVAILDMNEGAGTKLAVELSKSGVKARFWRCDVSDLKAVEAVAAQTAKDLGPATALVTCAGLIPNSESILEMDLVAHERMWAVNYNGTLYAARVYGKQMIPAKGGTIVTIGSINSRLPLPLAAYNPGKAAVERLTQLLAVELGRFGIRVNSVGPTYVMTPPLREKVASGQRDMKKIMGVHALDRLPEPSDIADAIAFLSSDQARSITGILLPVDAGWLSAVSYKTYAGGVPWKE
ncbi:MAG TPA: SDR family oxidoreductase [Hyphomicrobiaceae bacterium]|nr:SDR family oxidoreductase [Hyphomicrobiaceae bacterium]